LIKPTSGGLFHFHSTLVGGRGYQFQLKIVIIRALLGCTWCFLC